MGRKKTIEKHYKAGTWVTVPLGRGGFALGLIARATSKGGILCYFFGPRKQVIPELAEAESLRPQDAVKVVRAGDLHLLEGKWLILGELPSWNATDWPMPQFVRRSELARKAWRVNYSEDDLVTPLCEIPEPYDSVLEKDSIFGAEAAEIMLDHVLA